MEKVGGRGGCSSMEFDSLGRASCHSVRWVTGSSKAMFQHVMDGWGLQ